MPLKIPPFTPVQIQPTSAEPFSVFVENTPLAKTPLTGTELVPVIQNGVARHTLPAGLAGALGVGSSPVTGGTSGYALTDNAGVLGDAPIRTILTANTNYYVAVGGSDSANGLSPATAWATLQHAAFFIAGNLDIAGFQITANIGVGTFVGFGQASCVGGGVVQWLGAGSSSTTITSGPNDGFYNITEAISFYYEQDTVFAIDKSTLTVNPLLGGIYTLIATEAAGGQFVFGNFAGGGGDVILKPLAGISSFNINGTCLLSITANINLVVSPPGTTIGPIYDMVQNANATVGEGVSQWSFTGSPDWSGTNNAMFRSTSGSKYKSSTPVANGPNGLTFTGRVIVALNGSSFVNDAGPGNNGISFFPTGTLADVIDSSSSVVAYDGAISGSGLPTTTQFPKSGTSGIYKDTSGGGVYAVYNDAGTIKKVALVAGIGGPLLPSSVYLGGASGNLSSTIYIPVTNTNTAGAMEGVGVVASLGSNAPCVLQFNMPEIIPTGQLKLRMLAMSSAASNVAKVTVSDGQTASGSNIGATTLTSDGQSTITWTTADILVETKVNLSSSPGTANSILTVLVTFNSTGWTLAQISVWQFSLVWE